MLLKDKYFKIEDQQIDGQQASFRVSLLADCDVYRGHFPGHPVSPGVCNIEMLRECFLTAIGSSGKAGAEPRIKSIDRCRLTAVASPSVSPVMDVRLSWTNDDAGWHLTATLSDEQQQYLDFKGTLDE